MNESEFYKTVVQNEIVDDGAIRRYAKAAKPKRTHAFFRVLIPVAAALLLVFGVTMAIPSARAEVLSWFKPTTAGEYFSQPADEREPNTELDALIVPAEQSETHVEIRDAADSAIFTEIAKALETAELGDTMFDGEELYIRVRMDALGMLPEIEQLTCGNLTKTLIPPEETVNFFEEGFTPEAFVSGELPYWMDAESIVTFTFNDGAKLYGGWFATDDADIRPLLDSLDRDDLRNGLYTTPEQMAAINGLELAYLKDRTVNASITTYMLDLEHPSRSLLEAFTKHADENGRVTVTVGMEVAQDPGDGSALIVLDATLGEVTVDLEAYQSLKKTALTPDGNEAVFAPEESVFSLFEWRMDENGLPISTVTNRTISLDGLTLTPLDGAYIDARGIQNLRIRLTPPKDWDRSMLENLNMTFLDFRVLINGQTPGFADQVQMDAKKDGTVLITIGCVGDVPLDALNGVETVTLIPRLSYVSSLRTYAENDSDGELTDTFLAPGVAYPSRSENGTLIGETTEYPQYALTFTVE